MNRQRIGIALFWFGVIGIIAWQALTWLQSPIQRVNTAEELSGTLHAIWGPLFWIRILGGSGLLLSLLGVLLYTGKKGSSIWLLALVPAGANFLMYWEPAQYRPYLFGVGGTVILVSYFGILWFWTRSYAAYEGIARTGRLVQLLGYTFLVATGNLLCMYFGNPNQVALVDLPMPSAESINITLSLGMLSLLFGHYLVSKSVKSEIASPEESPARRQEVAAIPQL